MGPLVHLRCISGVRVRTPSSSLFWVKVAMRCCSLQRQGYWIKPDHCIGTSTREPLGRNFKNIVSNKSQNQRKRPTNVSNSIRRDLKRYSKQNCIPPFYIKRKVGQNLIKLSVRPKYLMKVRTSVLWGPIWRHLGTNGFTRRSIVVVAKWSTISKIISSFYIRIVPPVISSKRISFVCFCTVR